jgi:hypothetical protein
MDDDERGGMVAGARIKLPVPESYVGGPLILTAEQVGAAPEFGHDFDDPRRETLVAAQAAQAETELRPPPEYADKPLHWVRREIAEVWRVDGDGDWHPPCGGTLPPAAAYNLGYRYLGPAEWDLDRKPGHSILSRVREAVRQREARIADLEVQNARLLEMHERVRAERVAIFRAGVCTREQSQDNIVSAEELRALGWWQEMTTGDWHAPTAEMLRRCAWAEAMPMTAADAAAHPTPPRKGDFVTCEAGHLVCEVISDYRLSSHSHLGSWRVDIEHRPTIIAQGNNKILMVPTCPCGAMWSNNDKLHIKGRGWT